MKYFVPRVEAVEDDGVSLVLPVPPSSNNQYLARRIGRSARLIATPELRAYKRAIALLQATAAAQSTVHDWIRERKCTLQVSCDFYFPTSQVWTKAKHPKRLDTSNRIKATHDAIASLLNIDDSYFFCSIERKYAIPGEDSYVRVLITPRAGYAA